MRFFLQLLFFGTVAAADGGNLPKHVPARISYEELAFGSGGGGDGDGDGNRDDLFWKTLREVGLLSVTGIPDFNKRSMFEDLEDCLHHQAVGAPEFVYDDTDPNDRHRHRRRTLATRTLAGKAEDVLAVTRVFSDGSTKEDGDREKPCAGLRASSRTFRRAVQTVSEAVAARFGAASSGARTNDAAAAAHQRKIPIQSLINDGEHLEHFHSYYSEEKEDIGTRAAAATKAPVIDWHTDQGMMLLFTPGQRKDGTSLDGFFIRLEDGSTSEVAFDSRIDDLVIMLGDGVRQYVNDPSASASASFTDLRAVPHAVSLPPPGDAPRLWYGRMVLPPPAAIHPSGTRSFADLRAAMIRGDRDALALGCAEASDTARELMEDSHGDGGDHGDDEALECDEDVSMLCWMRCMNYSDYDVGVDSCASESESHALRCANDGGELWEHGIHSDEYYVRCLAAEDVVGGGADADDADHDHSDAKSNDPSSSAAGALAASSVALWTAVGLVLAFPMA